MNDQSVPSSSSPSPLNGPLGAGRVRRADTPGKADADTAWQRAFIDEFGELDLVPDRPRASMRVLGYMVVCRPAVQSAQQIMAGLGLSAGSVSNAVNALHNDKLLERVTRAGDRHLYYRLGPQGWDRAIAARLWTLMEVRRAADRALAASHGMADHRLYELRETYARVEAGLAQLLVHDD
jgi:hypothetical protein